MKVLVPSEGSVSWRRLLRDPDKQWRDDYSAKELAVSWESAGGFPREVGDLFRANANDALRNASPLLAIPEHRVSLPGGDASSQNDLFVLASGAGKLIAISVEGKANEPFAQPLSTWLQDASPGKMERLAFLKSSLGLSGELPKETRYQLLHRAASAVIEAQRFSACLAVLVVHSFSSTAASLPDYERFLELFGSHHEPGHLVQLGCPSAVPLFAGWAQAKPAA